MVGSQHSVTQRQFLIVVLSNAAYFLYLLQLNAVLVTMVPIPYQRLKGKKRYEYIVKTKDFFITLCQYSLCLPCVLRHVFESSRTVHGNKCFRFQTCVLITYQRHKGKTKETIQIRLKKLHFQTFAPNSFQRIKSLVPITSFINKSRIIHSRINSGPEKYQNKPKMFWSINCFGTNVS